MKAFLGQFVCVAVLMGISNYYDVPYLTFLLGGVSGVMIATIYLTHKERK